MMSAEIIKFPGDSKDRDQEQFIAPYSGVKFSRPLMKRNRRSPYRRFWQQAEMGFVELNKMEHQRTSDELARIRRGVEAAKALASAMAHAETELRAAKKKAKPPVRKPDTKLRDDQIHRVLDEYDRLPPDLQRIMTEVVRRLQASEEQEPA
jgi:hypothetical protein